MTKLVDRTAVVTFGLSPNYFFFKVGGGGGCAQFNFSKIQTKNILFTFGKNQQNIRKSFLKHCKIAKQNWRSKNEYFQSIIEESTF